MNFKNILTLRNFKFKSFALVSIVIVAAIIVLINIVADVLYQRFPLSIDFTSDRRYTLTDEMEDFVRAIEQDVTIYILSSEEHYTQNFSGVLRQNRIMGDGPSYAHQALILLKELPRLNSNITLEFVDPDMPRMAELQSAFPQVAELGFNAKFITSEIEVDGERITRYRAVSMRDLLALDTDQIGINIVGSNFETEMSNALHIVALERSHKAAIITSHNTQRIPAYASLLMRNNFEISIIPNPLTDDIEDDVEVLILSAPSIDFSTEEVQVISDFLYNDGELGRSLIYIASAYQPELPNLEAFLLEWGIVKHTGAIFETNTQNFQTLPTTILIDAFDNDMITGVNRRLYFSQMNRPLSISDNILGTIQVEGLVSFENSAVILPFDADESWRPNAADAGDYHLILHSSHMQTIGIDFVYSHVIAIASNDFVDEATNDPAIVANLTALMSITNHLVGAEDEPMFFAPRVINERSFRPVVTEFATNVVRIIFVGAIPILVVAFGIFVFVRRKNL